MKKLLRIVLFLSVVSSGLAIRIKDEPITATTAASDDYFVEDGATNGTRKILANLFVNTGLSYANPSWLTSLAFSKLTGLPSPVLTVSGDASGTATFTSLGSASTSLTVSSIGGKPVTLGGAFTMSGAFGFTGTVTATTAVTFPTSGTLVGSADTATVTNAMLAGSIAASKLIGNDIATVGTITTGTWNATAIADGKIASALTGKTYNGLTPTALTTGFSLAGGTTSKTLTVINTMTLAGTDAQTYTFPTTSATMARTDAAQTFTGTQTFAGNLMAGSNSATTASYIANAAAAAGNGGYFAVQSVGVYKSIFGNVAAVIGSGTDQSAMLQSYSDNIYLNAATSGKSIFLQIASSTAVTFSASGTTFASNVSAPVAGYSITTVSNWFSSGGNAFLDATAGAQLLLRTNGAQNVIISTNNTAAATFDSSQNTTFAKNIGIVGTAPLTYAGIYYNGTITASSGIGYGSRFDGTIAASANSDVLKTYSSGTVFSTGTFTGLTTYNYYGNQGSSGTGTITTAYGYYQTALTIGTINYAFFSAGAGLVKFSDTTDATALGTAANVLLGGLSVSKTLYVGTGANIAGVSNLASGTATPAGGSTSARMLFGTTSGFGIYYGSGAPTVSAAQGSIYLRSDGSSTSTRLYVNTNGSTTWTNATTAL